MGCHKLRFATTCDLCVFHMSFPAFPNTRWQLYDYLMDRLRAEGLIVTLLHLAKTKAKLRQIK